MSSELGAGREHLQPLTCRAMSARLHTDLPIEPLIPEILGALAAAPNLVLEAPPGAGKTTRVPLAMLDAPWARDGKIIVLEPRRLAARGAAARMAAMLGEEVGETVGYRVRLDYHAQGARPGHVMVFVTDRQTGEPVPYLPVSVTLHTPQGAPRRVALAPMTSDQGFHYGADVGVPDTTQKVTVSLGRPTIRAMAPDAARTVAPQELSFDWSAARVPAGGGGEGHKH